MSHGVRSLPMVQLEKTLGYALFVEIATGQIYDPFLYLNSRT